MMVFRMTDKQRRKIFKTAQEKNLDDEVLHNWIYALTKKSSIKDLNLLEAATVIDALEKKYKVERTGKITDKQRKYIEGLAKDLGWLGEDGKLDTGHLNGWIESKYAVSNMDALTTKQAAAVIEGLKAIESRISVS